MTLEEATGIVSLVIVGSQAVGALINNNRFETLRELISGKGGISERLVALEVRMGLRSRKPEPDNN